MKGAIHTNRQVNFANARSLSLRNLYTRIIFVVIEREIAFPPLKSGRVSAFYNSSDLQCASARFQNHVTGVPSLIQLVRSNFFRKISFSFSLNCFLLVLNSLQDQGYVSRGACHQDSFLGILGHARRSWVNSSGEMKGTRHTSPAK